MTNTVTFEDYDPRIQERQGKVPLSELMHFRCTELHIIARALLNWNCDQAISDKKHEQHYRKYIAPIHVEVDKRLNKRK